MKIEVGKFYKTRGGMKARIYAIDCGGNWQIHGAIQYDGFWEACEWYNNGERFLHSESILSLISEWIEPLDFDPSCLPAWAEWIAMDEYGAWVWSVREMAVTGPAWWCTPCEFMQDIGYIPIEYKPKNYTGDWKDSLHKVSDLKTNQS